MRNAVSRFYNYFFNADAILNSKRLAWIDYAKGLTIILVVYHHSFLTLSHSGVQVNPWLINANLSVYSFRMPMFFMLSGLFIAKGLQKRGVKKYIEYRARYLLYPYLLWAFLQATGRIIFSPYLHSDAGLKSYLVIFYQPNATSQFWYLITLFNTAVLYVLLSGKLHFNQWQQFIFGILLYMLSPFLFFNSMIQDTTRFYVYLVFGSLISNFILSEKNFKLISSARMFFPLLLLMFFSQYYLFKHQYLYRLEMRYDMDQLNWVHILAHFGGMLKFSAIVMIGCTFVLNVCAILQKVGKITFIRVVGYHSLYIYILHVLLVVFCRMIFVNLFDYENAFVILPVQIITAMICSVIIYNLCRNSGLNFLFEYDPQEFKSFFRKIVLLPKYQKV